MQLNGATQKQLYKLSILELHLRVTEGKTKNWVTPIGKAIAIMKALHYSVVMRRFSSRETKIVKNEAKLSIFGVFPFLPTLSLYGQKSLVMSERVLLQVQASKMRFLKISNFFLIDYRYCFFYPFCLHVINW